MGLVEALLAEFDQEAAHTRTTLERVSQIPADRFDWKPHEKSMSVRDLTTHLSNVIKWTVETINEDEYDYAPGGEPVVIPPVDSVEEAVKNFDENVRNSRAAIEGASDERLMGTWSLLANGEAVFTMPRAAVLRSMIMNHLIHHRAQLGVYLRLNDVPVPSIYGPTADES